MHKSSDKNSIVQTLQRAFADKKAKNKNYSLRAFARDLKVSQPLLTYIIQGQRPLSVNIAQRIADKLNLSEKEKEVFMWECEQAQKERKLNRKPRTRSGE